MASIGMRWRIKQPRKQRASRYTKKQGKGLEFDTEEVAAPPPISRSLTSAIKAATKRRAMMAWAGSESRGRDLYRIAPNPSLSVTKLHRQLTRPLSSILTQLRTGKLAYGATYIVGICPKSRARNADADTLKRSRMFSLRADYFGNKERRCGPRKMAKGEKG